MKTTIIGIATIVAALASAVLDCYQTGSVDFGVLVPAVLGGIGLIKAADQKP
jgi:hypothetical protein